MASLDYNEWPLSGYNFIVEIDGFQYSFKEVSGLEVQIQTKAKTEDHVIMNIPTGERKYTNVTLKRGVAAIGSMLADWIYNVSQPPLQGLLDTRTVNIHLVDDQGQNVLMWELEKAYPVKYSVGALNASENSIAFESVELAYKQFTLNS